MTSIRDGGTPAPLTFGASLGRLSTGAEVVEAARSAEAAGFSVLNASDHLGNTSPFTVLGAAAAVTTSVRLRTYVLDAYFWNPALLAREVATIDALSAGRFELGLGAGHMRHEHLDAGLPFPPITARVALMESLLSDVRSRLSSGSYTPAPVQRPVPVALGVWGSAGLRVAASSAEIVALTGMVQVPGAPAGTFSIASSADTDAKLAELRSLPRDLDTPPVLDALLQRVVVSGSPPDVVAAMLAEEDDPSTTVEEILDSPFFLFASSPAEAAAELLRRRDRWGITSWCTHAASTPALTKVVQELNP